MALACAQAGLREGDDVWYCENDGTRRAARVTHVDAESDSYTVQLLLGGAAAAMPEVERNTVREKLLPRGVAARAALPPRPPAPAESRIHVLFFAS